MIDNYISDLIFIGSRGNKKRKRKREREERNQNKAKKFLKKYLTQNQTT